MAQPWRHLVRSLFTSTAPAAGVTATSASPGSAAAAAAAAASAVAPAAAAKKKAEVQPVVAGKWEKGSRRTGAIGVKLGMTSDWDAWGKKVPLTVLQLQDNEVVGVRTEEKHGYTALQIGACPPEKVWRLRKPDLGQFAAAGVEPKREVTEFRVTKDAVLPVGTKITAAHFAPGQLVDVCGFTIGKGFQGGMKRHNMNGGRASHGSTLQHRKIGSIGSGGDPARVWPGKKMPGHMGNVRRVNFNLSVFKVDTRWNVVFLRGSVPGHKQSVLTIKDSITKASEFLPPFPTAVGAPASEVLEEPKAEQNPFKVMRVK